MSKRRRARRQRARRPPAKRRGWGLPLAALVGLPLVLGAAGLAWIWPRCGNDCPSVESLRRYVPPQASRVFDSEGKVLAQLAPENRVVVPLEEIPPLVANAFLAVEDKRFFRHHGVDYRRVGGAVLSNLRQLRFAEGFSTITMQLARNLFPDHLSRDKTLGRKLWEVFIAREIEGAFSKQEILELYLNQIYLGDGLHGVEAAAQGYFGVSVRELSAGQAALLAALPKAPERYNPRENPERARERRDLVLSLMAGAGVTSASEAERARVEPIELAPPIEGRGSAPYFVAAVREQLEELFGPYADREGLRVYTTLDRDLQRAAEKGLLEQLRAVEQGSLGGFAHPVCGSRQGSSACLQGAFVALDPKSGDVLALVGGRDFGQSQFNRATLALRQPGSAFKPFVYAAAISLGLPVTTPLLGPGAEPYQGDYFPADAVPDSVRVDLREALRRSSNQATVVLGERVGVERVIETARALGISTPIPPYPSILLGAAEVVPIELVAAYAPFGNGGVAVEPRFIERVEDARGSVLYRAPVVRRHVLSPPTAFLTLDLMRGVVDGGTGWRVREAGLPAEVPAAGKTGTTNDAADVWFVGMTPELVAGVWLGFDRRVEISPAAGGGRFAAPVWGRVMASYYAGRPAPPEWTPPEGLVRLPVDQESGLPATSACPEESIREEWFVAGSEPEGHCPLHPEPEVEGWFQRGSRGLGELLDRRPE
ncbi:MAG: penicillin-binding protein 1A [Longimicrobiaceae bacterium]